MMVLMLIGVVVLAGLCYILGRVDGYATHERFTERRDAYAAAVAEVEAEG